MKFQFKIILTTIQVGLLIFFIALGALTASPTLPKPCDIPESGCTEPWRTWIMGSYVEYNSEICQVRFFYAERKCNGHIEVQLQRIDMLGQCNVPADVIIQQCLNRAVDGTAYYYELPPFNPIGQCYEFWKSTGAACWSANYWTNATWMFDPAYKDEIPYANLITPAPPPYFLEILFPCEGTQCCYQKETVCYLGGGKYSHTPIDGPVLFGNDCANAKRFEFPLPDPNEFSPCLPTCSALLYLRQGEIDSYINKINTVMSVNIDNSKNILNININTNNNESVNIDIFDIQGNIIESLILNSMNNINIFEKDVSSYNTGIYILKAYSGTNNYGIAKFTVIQ